jgi:putative hydrolase of the HAD superfamily
VKQGAAEAILAMAAHVPVYLLTAGDDAVQRSRVEKLPFKDSFKGIYIVPEKDPALYTALLAKHGLQPAEAVMIGDSLKSDIVSPVAAGMTAVYIPDMNWAAREQAGQEFPSERATQVKDISEAVAFLLPQITATPDVKPAQVRRKPPAP